MGVKPNDPESYAKFVFNPDKFKLGRNGHYATEIVEGITASGEYADFVFKKVKPNYNTYHLYVFKTTDPSNEEIIYSDSDGVSGIY
jgi:hypothetical protein